MKRLVKFPMTKPLLLSTLLVAVPLAGLAGAQGTKIRRLGGDRKAAPSMEEVADDEGGWDDSAPYDHEVSLGGAGMAGGDQGGRPAPPAQVPEVHTVQKGDTLWDVSQRYYTDPWRWPQLWAQNPLITNPHWIFPGDVVRLKSPEMGVPLAVVDQGPAPRNAAPRATPAGVYGLREIGFVAAQDLKGRGLISGSPEEKIMLASGDRIYASYKNEQPLKAGERYTVYQVDEGGPVKHPKTGKVLGYLVRLYGDVTVDQITKGNVARGTLVNLVEPVERGYAVGPVHKQFKHLKPRPSKASLEGELITTVQPSALISHSMFVVLDRGKKDGVEVGNRLFVVRRGDGYRQRLEEFTHSDERFPREIVGELLAVDVQESVTVAWVVRSIKELQAGDRWEMRSGY